MSTIDLKTKDLREWVQQHRLLWGLFLAVVIWLSRLSAEILFPQWHTPTLDFYETLPFTLFLLAWFVFFSVGLVGGGIVWLTRASWKELGWHREGLLKAIGLGVLGFVLNAIAMIPIALIQGSPEEPPAYMLPSLVRFLLVTFFAFGIAAWIEENLFRGYLQPLLVKRSNLIMAVFIQAGIFTATHLGYATGLNLAWIFISGLVFGWLRGYHRNIVAPYIAHALGWMMTVFSAPAF